MHAKREKLYLLEDMKFETNESYELPSVLVRFCVARQSVHLLDLFLNKNLTRSFKQ